MSAMSRTAKILFAAAAVFVAAQFVPVERSNPAIESHIPAPESVKAVLERSCYDCHSHETRWPWYAHLAPVSWLVVYDVHEAREHLNFSAWNRYDRVEQREKIEEVWEEVEEGEMPLWYYLPLHPDAALSAADQSLLREWAEWSEGDSR